MAGPSPRQGLGRTTVWRRAQELKKELLRPTVKLPEGRASRYEADMLLGRTRYVPPRQRSVFVPFCIALFLGALTMLIPVSGTFTLQGTLLAKTEPAAAPAAVYAAPVAVAAEPAAAVVDPAAAAPQAAQAAAEPAAGSSSFPEGMAGSAVVFAEPADCPWIQLNEPSIVTIDVPGQSDLVVSASILAIEARTQNAAQAAANTATPPACRVELALLPEGEEGAVLRGLPLGAAARADFPTTRSWIGAVVAQMPSDSRQAFDRASVGLRSLGGLLGQLYRTYIAPRLHSANAQK